MNTPFVAVRSFSYDIEVDQGSDFGLPFEFYDHANRPIRFAGYSARMQVRRTPSSSTVIDDLDSTSENPRLTFSSNVITMTWNHDQTAKIKAGRYYYCLEVTSPNGQVSRLLEGAFVVHRGIIR